MKDDEDLMPESVFDSVHAGSNEHVLPEDVQEISLENIVKRKYHGLNPFEIGPGIKRSLRPLAEAISTSVSDDCDIDDDEFYMISSAYASVRDKVQVSDVVELGSVIMRHYLDQILADASRDANERIAVKTCAINSLERLGQLDNSGLSNSDVLTTLMEFRDYYAIEGFEKYDAAETRQDYLLDYFRHSVVPSIADWVISPSEFKMLEQARTRAGFDFETHLAYMQEAYRKKLTACEGEINELLEKSSKALQGMFTIMYLYEGMISNREKLNEITTMLANICDKKTGYSYSLENIMERIVSGAELRSMISTLNEAIEKEKIITTNTGIPMNEVENYLSHNGYVRVIDQDLNDQGFNPVIMEVMSQKEANPPCLVKVGLGNDSTLCYEPGLITLRLGKYALLDKNWRTHSEGSQSGVLIDSDSRTTFLFVLRSVIQEEKTEQPQQIQEPQRKHIHISVNYPVDTFAEKFNFVYALTHEQAHFELDDLLRQKDIGFDTSLLKSDPTLLIPIARNKFSRGSSHEYESVLVAKVNSSAITRNKEKKQVIIPITNAYEMNLDDVSRASADGNFSGDRINYKPLIILEGSLRPDTPSVAIYNERDYKNLRVLNWLPYGAIAFSKESFVFGSRV
ncbi:hypothetical protein KY312_03320 [Candidatus Woesearchaeota archaeon]|nr:hypothetical protein [Candidatus Woesearchaeota archaeon]